MQLDLQWVGRSAAAKFHRLFGGRIARTTFALRVAILWATIYILAAPQSTFLASSPKTLKDAYLVLFLAMLALCLLGFVSAYVKRLHDIGLRGYWALAFLVLLPAAIIGGGYLYEDYRYNADHTYNTAELNRVIGYVALFASLLVAMWRGESGENRIYQLPPGPLMTAAEPQLPPGPLTTAAEPQLPPGPLVRAMPPAT